MTHLQSVRAKWVVSFRPYSSHLSLAGIRHPRRCRFCVSAEAAAHNRQAAPVQLPPELADFRPNVGMCVVNSAGLIFAATRVDDAARRWQMPQGGIDPGEDPLHAAVRELCEETTITSVELLAEAPSWLHYEFPSEMRCRLTGSWANYRGQVQRWFLFKFTGADSEVNLDTNHKEFSEWCWMPLEQLPDKVVEFKRPVYEAVAAEFGPVVAAIRQQSSSLCT